MNNVDFVKKLKVGVKLKFKFKYEFLIGHLINTENSKLGKMLRISCSGIIFNIMSKDVVQVYE